MDDIQRRLARIEADCERLEKAVKMLRELTQILLDLVLEDRPHLARVIEALKEQANVKYN